MRNPEESISNNANTDGSTYAAKTGADLIKEVGLITLLKEDWNTHFRQLTAPGLWAVMIYRFGVWSTLLPVPFKWLGIAIYVLAQRTIRNVCGIELERSVKLGRRLNLAHQHGIVIHRHATIGDDVLIRHSVTFGRGASWTGNQGPIIGNRVEFSPGAVIIGNVVIGDDVSVGPNCVVSQNVPAGRSLFIPPPRSLPKKETIATTQTDANSGQTTSTKQDKPQNL